MIGGKTVRSLIRNAPSLVTLAGTIALARFVWIQKAPIVVSVGIRCSVFGVGALSLWVGLLCAVGENADSRGVQMLLRGAARAGPAALPLVALPFLARLSAEHASLALRVVLGTTLMFLALAERRARADRVNMPRLAPPELCSLVFCVCAIAWFVVVAMHTSGSGDNDAAYYFGVARHIVKTGRFEEPIVWQFLNLPRSVVHRPFDYWQGLTSLVLLPAMFLFGPTSRVALLTMAAISGLALLVLWYLIAIVAPLRHRVSQYIALLTFATAPAMKMLRFDTDSVPVFHLALLTTLTAFAARRHTLAVCLATLLYFTRGDGLVLCALVWTASLAAASSEVSASSTIDSRAARSTWLQPLAAVLMLAASYAGYSLWRYGAVTPPTPRLAASLAGYFDLYRFPLTSAPSHWLDRLTPASVGGAIWDAWNNLRAIPFLPQQTVFMVVVLLVGWRRSTFRPMPLVYCLLFAGSGLVSVAAGVVFSAYRTLYTMLPLVVLAVAGSLDHVLQRDASLAARVDVARAGIAAIVMLWVGGALADVRPYGERGQPRAALERDAHALDSVVHGAIVATMQPWSVMASSDSPALMIPDSDEASLETAFRHYQVRWLVLSDEPCLGRAAPVCKALLDGTKKNVGALQVVSRIRRGDMLALRLEARTATRTGGG